jgi:hypothetical protein
MLLGAVPFGLLPLLGVRRGSSGYIHDASGCRKLGLAFHVEVTCDECRESGQFKIACQVKIAR